MDAFVYNCPSCGGKVNYDVNEHKWNCEYCGNKYDALFAKNEEKELPNVENIKLTLYSFICENCGKRFVHDKENDKTCPNCAHLCSNNGTPFVASGIVDLSISNMYAKNCFFIETKGSSFFNDNLVLQYVNCDLYNGCVIVSYNNIIEKYIFINLLIPNLDYEDYRFIYEVGNIGLNQSDPFFNNNCENIKQKIISNGQFLNSIENKNYESDIVNQCVKSFAKKYNVTNLSKIIVDNNFNVKDGVYVPFYITTSKNNGDIYYQYVFGSEYMKRPILSFFKNAHRTSSVLLSLPKVNNSRKKANFCYNICSFLVSSCILSTIVLFSFFYLSDIMNDSLKIVLIIFCITYIIISILLYIYFSKKYQYYDRSICLTKEEYLEQIINNSNYVKVIKVNK